MRRVMFIAFMVCGVVLLAVNVLAGDGEGTLYALMRLLGRLS